MYRGLRLTALALTASVALCACFGEDNGEDPPQLAFPEPPPIPGPPSPPPPPTPPPITEIGPPVRHWHLNARNAFDGLILLSNGGTTTGLDRNEIAGGVVIVPAGFDDQANVEAFSSESGKTYWVSAEAPQGTLERTDSTAFGATASLYQFHQYRKDAEDATLELIVSAVDLQVIDFSDLQTHPNDVCPWVPSGALDHPRCFDQVSATVEMDIVVYDPTDADANGHFRTLDHHAGASQISGYNSRWAWNPAYVPARSHELAFPAKPIFRSDQFTSSLGFVPDIITTGQDARLQLARDSVVSLDLSAVPREGVFGVTVAIHALSHNRQAREAYARAMLRDPVRLGGVAVNSTGLTELKPPDPLPELGTPDLPECAAPEGQEYPAGGGRVQFTESSYLVPEFEQAYATIFVERVGGSQGTQVVTVSSQDGTAVAGSEYESLRQDIAFHDGDDIPRAIALLVRSDARASGDTDLTLTLSAAANCGQVGDPASTRVTIVDDDQRPGGGGGGPPASGTVGGTVSGLQGSGLVLEDRANLVDLAIAADGPFVFDRAYPAGAAYDVRVQANPVNPAQVCSVANGAGTSAGAAISNVEVSCDPPAPVGSLDPTFGSAGKAVITSLGAADQIAALADGKILARAGSVIARFLGNGALDTTFGTNGAVSVTYESATATRVNSFTVQPDGRILVTGAFVRTSLDNDVAVARLNPDGSTDATFGAGGKAYVVRSGSFEQGVKSLVQSDGRIVVAGNADVPPPGLVSYNDFSVVRLNADGAVDATFGAADGRTVVDIAGRTDILKTAALQADDRIVVTGRVAPGGGANPDLGIVRFNADGTIDTAFGANGKVRLDVAAAGEWDEPTGMALQPDGRIVIAMQSNEPGLAFPFSVARFDPNGSLDATFAGTGVARTPIGAGNALSNAVAIQADGRIVLVGSAPSATVNDFGIVRYLPTGVLDTTFDGDGVLTVDFFGGNDSAKAVALQSDGRIVVGGTALNGASFSLALMRVMP